MFVPYRGRHCQRRPPAPQPLSGRPHESPVSSLVCFCITCQAFFLLKASKPARPALPRVQRRTIVIARRPKAPEQKRLTKSDRRKHPPKAPTESPRPKAPTESTRPKAPEQKRLTKSDRRKRPTKKAPAGPHPTKSAHRTASAAVPRTRTRPQPARPCARPARRQRPFRTRALTPSHPPRKFSTRFPQSFPQFRRFPTAAFFPPGFL